MPVDEESFSNNNNTQVKEQLLSADAIDVGSPPVRSRHKPDHNNNGIRNTLLLGAGFFFTFTAWHSAQNLQSSLQMPQGVNGTTALTIVYSLLPIGFALGHTVVRCAGKKRTVVISMAMYGTFIVANIHPRWWSIYPGAVMVGLACGPMFVSQNTLLTEYALNYAVRRGEEKTSRVGMFQGIFQGFFMLTQAVGNIFYSLLFRSQQGADGGGTPSHATIVFLFAIYTGGCVVVGIFIIGGGVEEEQLDTEAQPVANRDKTEGWLSALALVGDAKMWSLLPYLLSSGLIWAFVIDDFTARVVKPRLGEDNLGFVMALNGASSVGANLLCSRYGDARGAVSRAGIFVLGCVVNAGVTLFLYLGEASLGGEWLGISLISIAMGCSTAASTTMLNAHISAYWIGETDAAFGCAQTFLGAAQAIGFFLAGSLPMHTVLLFAAPAQIAGGVGFLYSTAQCRAEQAARAGIGRALSIAHTS